MGREGAVAIGLEGKQKTHNQKQNNNHKKFVFCFGEHHWKIPVILMTKHESPHLKIYVGNEITFYN